MPMREFSIKPTICFGEDGLMALEALSGKRVMVVTDEFLFQSGLLERVLERLVGCTVEVFREVTPDPSLKLVAKGARRLADFRPDGVVAFGGGSPMDCAKAMMEFGKKLGAGENVRFYAVPTTAGSGSEVTSFAVLTDTDRGVKYPLVDDALLPDVAILEPAFLAGVPPAVTADTGMDVITHAVEAYVSRNGNPFTDAMAEKAVVMAYQNLRAAHGGDMDAKGELLLASCLAGLSFNAAGLGMNHALAHSLGGRYHVPHGRINTVLLPHVIAFNAAGGGHTAAKYGRLAELCGLAPNYRSLISGLNRLRTALHMPEGLAACGVERAALLRDSGDIAAAALGDLCMPTNPRAPAEGELKSILKGLV